MHFTYDSYIDLIKLLKLNNYEISDYVNYQSFYKCVILRHDVDYSLEKAVKLAEIESNLGISSTYFVLLTSDFYNLFSKKNESMLKDIIALGHNVGLHFDEMRYPDSIGDELFVKDRILYESSVLSEIAGKKVDVVSMHRPSKQILASNLNIPNMINSYSKTFFNEFKYLSDSRRNWREPVEDIVSSANYKRLHILTHAFWYNDVEIGMVNTLNSFLENAEIERYNTLKENFTNLESVLTKYNVMGGC